MHIRDNYKISKFFKIIVLCFFILITLSACSHKPVKTFLVKNEKIALPPLYPFSVRGLNGYIVNDENNNPIYLISISGIAKSVSWTMDKLRINDTKNLSSSKIDKIYTDHQEHIYMQETVKLKVRIKRLTNRAVKTPKFVTIPYLLLINLNNNKYVQANLKNSHPLTEAKATYSFVQKILDKSPFIVKKGVMKINLNNKQQELETVIKLRFIPEIYEGLEMLVAFDLDQKKYNDLEKYLDNMKK